jgi:membrane-associated phospholipid phosphatase
VAPGWAKTATDINQLTNWQVSRFEQQGSTLWVHLGEVASAYRQERLERLVAVLHRDAPVEFRRFVLTYAERGMALGMHEVDRLEYVARRSGERLLPETARGAPGGTGSDTDPATAMAPAAVAGQPTRTPLPREELLRPAGDAVAGGGVDDPANPSRRALWQRSQEALTYSVRPSYQQILGGPDGLVLYQLAAEASGQYRFAPGTWLDASVRLRLLDNYDNFTYTAPSNLPRVRTFAREFVTTSRVTIPNLQLTHVRQISENQYVSVYGGLLESMYAGVGGEWLYRPWRSPVAFGVDLNHVRQRGFRQDFALRDYSVTTGHATVYWDTGWNGVNVTVQAGRYLAGDLGATFTVSRRFANGFTVGAWATRTNVSAAQFGEGSFDKGIFVSVPFDAFLPSRTPFWGNLAWTPLTRDGGARLGRSISLHGLTDARDPRAFAYGPRNTDPPGTGTRLFGAATPDAAGGGPFALAGDLLGSGLELAQQATEPAAGLSWLAGAAAVAGASLADKPADRWARTHQGARWQQLAKGADALPLLMGAGVSLLATGLGGEDLQRTAWTSLKAAGFSLGANLAMRTALGRARPEQNLGPASFTGPSASSYKSGLPSNHVATAFALVTPFAQQYQMPWLYGLAATSAFGRIQQRKHWVSDAVAGGVMGYAIGSLLTDQQRQRTGLQGLSLTPNGLAAHWVFD